MKPEVKVFTKQKPCTKKDIWNCFRVPAGFAKVQVDLAHTKIGVNVPRVMERQGYLVKESLPKGDYYSLTSMGQSWLENGIKSFLRNHPAEAKNVLHMPRPALAKVGNRVVRTRR